MRIIEILCLTLKDKLFGKVKPPQTDPTKTISSLLDSSHLDASNDGRIMSLASIDRELLINKLKQHLSKYLAIYRC